MHLKKQLKAHIKKADIPDVSKNIMSQLSISHKQQNYTLKKSPFMLQFSAFLFLMIGVIVFSYQQSSSQIYAFTEYEEVLGLTTSLVMSMDEEDSIVSTTSLSSTIPTSTEIIDMLSYLRYIENIVVTQQKVIQQKRTESQQERFSVRIQTFSQSEVIFDMDVRKEYQNYKQDVFKFEANYDDVTMKGYTELKDHHHKFYVSVTTIDAQLNITYDSDEKRFDVLKTGENVSDLSFSFKLTRNNLYQPIIELIYEKDASEIKLITQYSFVKKTMHIQYVIIEQSMTREGSFKVNIRLDQGIVVDVEGETDQGETFQFQFQRRRNFSSDFQ